MTSQAGKRDADSAELERVAGASKRVSLKPTSNGKILLLANPTSEQIRDCHEEPIQFCGAVHARAGAFIVAKDCGDTQTICFASDNAPGVLGCDAAALMEGRLRVEDLFGPDMACDVVEFYKSSRRTLVRGAGKMHVCLHKLGTYVVLEAEPRASIFDEDTAEVGDFLGNVIARLHECKSLHTACDVLVAHLKTVSGFSRVMVYKFDADYSGKVIAEARDEQLEPFLNLHYPASDIPEQARQLYRKNWTRIVDASGLASAIRPCGDQHPEMLDLTYSRYRATSPLHIRYLQNMGVFCSMSISLIVNNKLWGLVACHSYDGYKPVRLPVLMMYEVLAHSLSLTISQIEQEEIRSACLRNTQKLGQVMHSDDAEMPECMATHAEKLMDVFKATGFLLARAPGYLISVDGETPTPLQMKSLLEFMTTQCTTRHPVFHSDCLSKQYPPAEEYADVAAGLLVVRMTLGHFILLFRPEYVRTINWGGKPEKTIESTEDGARYFGPRRSFKLYADTVRLHAAQWSADEIELTEQLSRTLVDRQQRAQKMRLDREAARAAISAQTQFLASVSRQLQSPMHGIMGFLGLLSETSLTREQIDYISTLTSCSDQLLHLAGDMLSFSQHCESFILLEKVMFSVEQGCRDVIEDVRTRHADHCPEIRFGYVEAGMPPGTAAVGDRDRFMEVITNLLTNAVNATPPTGVITIEAHCVTSSLYPGRLNVTVTVADTGCGVAEEELNNIFNTFQRAPTGPGRLGAGMGLCISRKLAVSMGGDITARSSLSVGSTFTFTCVLDFPSPPNSPVADSHHQLPSS